MGLYFKHTGWRRGYTQLECALALGISTRTVRRMLTAGKLLTIVVNQRRWISPISVDDLLFEPSRLTKIIEEIDRIAGACADKHPGRTARKQLEGTHHAD